jgi:hypothetical protein
VSPCGSRRGHCRGTRASPAVEHPARAGAPKRPAQSGLGSARGKTAGPGSVGPPNEQPRGGVLVPLWLPASLRRREPHDHVAVALARAAEPLQSVEIGWRRPSQSGRRAIVTSPRTGSSSLPCPRRPHELRASTIPSRRSFLGFAGPVDRATRVNSATRSFIRRAARPKKIAETMREAYRLFDLNFSP